MRFGIGLLSFRIGTPFFDEGGGAGAGTGAPTGGNPGATPPASPGGGTPSGQPSGAPSGTPNPGSGTPSGGGTGTPSGFTYKEDRSNWVPSHVVRERTEKAKQLERELEYERRRVAALTGVSMPKPPANPEHEQIRQQFFEMFPQFKALAELDPEKLAKVTSFDFEALQRANQETSERIWANHGTRAVQTFEAKAKELYGAVEPKQLKRMINAFAAEVQDDPDMTRRYEAGDFSIIDEWLSDWSKQFIEPIRKQASTPTPGQFAARRLPRAGGGSAVAGPKPPSLKPSDGDKFHEAAFDAFMRARG